MRIRFWLLPLLLLAAAIGLRAQDAPAQIPTVAQLRDAAFTSPLEAQGKYDELVRQWLGMALQHPNSPESGILLRRAREVRDHCADFNALVSEFLPAMELTKFENGFNLFLWRQLELDLAISKGEWERLHAFPQQWGYLTHGLLIGPFGYEDSGALLHDSVFAPETEIRIDGEYPVHPGALRSVRWKRAALDPYSRTFSPFEHNISRGCCYALFQVNLAEETPLLLTAELEAPYTLWINGRPAITADHRKQRLYDVRSFRLTLGSGWNQLLLKLPDAGDFALRLMQPNGMPVEGLSVEKESILWTHKSRPEPVQCEETPLHTVSALQAQLSVEGDSAFHHAALAYLLRSLDEDAALRHMEQAVTLDAHPSLLWRISAMYESSFILPHAFAASQAKKCREEALAKDPGHIPALIDAAFAANADDDQPKCFGFFDKAAKVNPDFFYIPFMQATLALDHGWLNEFRQHIAHAERLAPRHTGVASLRASYYRQLNNHQKELETYYSIRQWDRDIWLERQVASALTRMAKYEEAISQYRSLEEAAPEPDYNYQIARLYILNGHPERAVEEYHRLFEQNKDDHRLLLFMCDTLTDMGAEDKALQALREYCALEPGDEDALRRLQFRTKQAEDFALPYRQNVQELAAQAPPIPEFPKSNTLSLLHQAVVQLYPDYSYSVITHNAYQILTKAGHDDVSAITPEGELLEARTFTRDGSILEPEYVPGSPLVMPGLEVGAVVEYRERTHVAAVSPLHFWFDPFFFQDPNYSAPFMRAEFIVIIPDGLDIDVLTRNMDSVAPVKSQTPEGDTVLVYAMDNQSRMETEPMMPAAAKLMPNARLAVKTGERDALHYYNYDTALQDYPTQTVRDEAAKVVEGKISNIEKAEALYYHVNRLITAESNETSAHAVLLSRSGDRAALFRSMMLAAGVPFVAAWSRNNQFYEEAPVEGYRHAADFYYPLIGVKDTKGQWVWIDFTSRFQRFGAIPESLWNSSAVIPACFDPEGVARIVPVPGNDLEEATIETNSTLELDGGGQAQGELTLRLHGLSGAGFNQMLINATGDERESQLGPLVAQVFPGCAMVSLECPELENLGSDAVIRFAMRGERFCDLRNGGGEIPVGMPRLADIFDISRWVSETERTYDLEMIEHHRAADQVVVKLDDGVEVEALPDNAELDTPFGKYSLCFTKDENVVTISRLFEFKPMIIKKDDYNGLVDFVSAILNAENARIKLKRTQE